MAINKILSPPTTKMSYVVPNPAGKPVNKPDYSQHSYDATGNLVLSLKASAVEGFTCYDAPDARPPMDDSKVHPRGEYFTFSGAPLDYHPEKATPAAKPSCMWQK